jgi:FkbM family methyltransferase
MESITPFLRQWYRAARAVFERGLPERLVNRLCLEVTDIYFVQVGANDGVTGDPIHDYVIRYHWKGLLVEPLPDMFRQLSESYRRQDGLIFENVAISDAPGSRDMYRISAVGLSSAQLPYWAKAIGSFFNDRNPLGGQSVSAADFERIRPFITVEKVRCDTLDNLLRKHGVTRIDVLQVDVEGYDYHILKQLDFRRFRPKIIRIEWLNLPEDERRLTLALLKSQKYRMFLSGNDLIAFSGLGALRHLVRKLKFSTWLPCIAPAGGISSKEQHP